MKPSDFTTMLGGVRETIENSGVSIAEWARVNGFSAGLVYQILEGKRRCLRGQSYRIAIALGLKEGAALDVAALSKLLAANRQTAVANSEKTEGKM